MERQLITCPETGHLEQIELERTPYGVVIASCSRFERPCGVQCTRECARRMDHRDRRDVEDRGDRVLVVYADARYTRSIAEQLATLLSREQMIVELAVAQDAAPPPDDYQAVVVGTATRFWRQPHSILRYVARHRDALAAMPSFLFSVGDAPAKDLGVLAERTGWLPKRIAAFARPRGPARWFGDRDALAVSNHDAVRSFARAIGDEVPAAELQP